MFEKNETRMKKTKKIVKIDRKKEKQKILVNFEKVFVCFFKEKNLLFFLYLG